MHTRAREFRDRAGAEVGFDPEIVELPEGTHTARDAADAIGCSIAQIVKSLVMAVDDDLVVVLTSGPRRVDEGALPAAIGRPDAASGPADADAVKETLGWSIGGVPPFAHDRPVETYVDPTLLEHDRVWAGAGTPSAVFSIEPDRLVEITGATAVDAFVDG